MNNYKPDTICIHAGYTPGNGEPRVLPIVQSTTYTYESSQEMGDLFDQAGAEVHVLVGGGQKDGVGTGIEFFVGHRHLELILKVGNSAQTFYDSHRAFFFHVVSQQPVIAVNLHIGQAVADHLTDQLGAFFLRKILSPHPHSCQFQTGTVPCCDNDKDPPYR